MIIYDATMYPATHPLPGMKAIETIFEWQITDSTGQLVPSKIPPPPPGNQPTMLDMETNRYHLWPTRPDLSDCCAAFCQVADAVRATGRTNIGFFGAYPMYRNDVLCMGDVCADLLSVWNAGNAVMAPLLLHIDTLYLPAYLDDQNVTFPVWVHSTKFQIAAARPSHKPIRLVLRPTYGDESGPVPGWLWSSVLQFCRRMIALGFIDSVIVWENPKRQFVAGLQ